MALSFPYALDFLAQCLIGPEIPLTLHRFDEMSGSGDGRFWSAQLAAPLWGASYPLFAQGGAHSREINAKVMGLDGTSKTILWADPYYNGPASGVTAGLTNVRVSSIRADRGAIALSGLPVGFVASAGDYLSINFGTDRVYFGQFVEGGTANASGTLVQREVRPYLPMSIATNAVVELLRPRFKAMITEFQPFGAHRGGWGQNASVTILQKT